MFQFLFHSPVKTRGSEIFNCPSYLPHGAV